jgi:membrane-bound metal-dependent hydrolase YbcI (DUF457 family)
VTPFAHLSSGLLVSKLYKASWAGISGRMVLRTAIVGSFFPDIDGLFGSNLNVHRYTMFHAPLCYLFLFAIFFLLGKFLKNVSIQKIAIVFTTSVLIHLFLDWVSARTCGVMLFYPFSSKPFSLLPIKPEMGDMSVLPDKNSFRFWSFYLENKFLVAIELVVIVLGLVMYAIKDNNGGKCKKF